MARRCEAKGRAVRVYLEPWVVQDGQVPELRAGDTLRDVGVVAACWSRDRSDGVDSCEEVPGGDPDGFSTAQSVLDGVLIWRSRIASGFTICNLWSKGSWS